MKDKNTLEIKNLHASVVGGKPILNGINLTIKSGEIHAVMGPNGSGKSTLAQVLMGSPGYELTNGNILLCGHDITNVPPNERAKKGLFLAFQYPVEVAGVNFAGFLRMALNEKSVGKDKISPLAFRKDLEKKASELAFSDNVATRSLNEGFSGGEKKKSEILQLSILKPKFAILDEPDSGLDVDALKYITKSVLSQKKNLGLLLITHYQRILNYIKPDHVHILIGGNIVMSGGAQLAKNVEKYGYEKYIKNKK